MPSPRYDGIFGRARVYVVADGAEREAGGATLQIEGADVAARGTVGRRGRPGVVANWAGGGSVDTSAGGAVQACQGKSRAVRVHVTGAKIAEKQEVEEEEGEEEEPGEEVAVVVEAHDAQSARTCSLITISLSDASWISPWAPGLLILVSVPGETHVSHLPPPLLSLPRNSPVTTTAHHLSLPASSMYLSGVRAPRHAL